MTIISSKPQASSLNLRHARRRRAISTLRKILRIVRVPSGKVTSPRSRPTSDFQPRRRCPELRRRSRQRFHRVQSVGLTVSPHGQGDFAQEVARTTESTSEHEHEHDPGSPLPSPRSSPVPAKVRAGHRQDTSDQHGSKVDQASSCMITPPISARAPITLPPRRGRRFHDHDIRDKDAHDQQHPDQARERTNDMAARRRARTASRRRPTDPAPRIRSRRSRRPAHPPLLPTTITMPTEGSMRFAHQNRTAARPCPVWPRLAARRSR